MKSKINQVTRYGAYGVLLQGSQILLTLSKSGPYKGHWGLPGGGIEFGETPEEALKRELLEETSLAIHQLEFFNIITSVGSYDKNGEPYHFHHVGLIYKVLDWAERPDLVAEEENRWVSLDSIKPEELIPFAYNAISSLPKELL